MKKQVVLIDGGETFQTYEEYLDFLKSLDLKLERLRAKKWHDSLGDVLGESFDVLVPKMPNKLNAKYAEWKIYFEKIVPLLDPEVILIGHSLGGIFLAKYLSENDFPKKIVATFLLAAPYDDQGKPYSLADFALPGSLNKLTAQGGTIFLYHSKDDPVVDFSDMEKYQKALPQAKTKIFADRGHFLHVAFPELVENIKHIS